MKGIRGVADEVRKNSNVGTWLETWSGRMFVKWRESNQFA